MYESISNRSVRIPENLTNFLNYLDASQRVFSLITHLMYFILVIRYKKLRYKSYIFINHFMLANFLYCAIYLFFIKSEMPGFSTSRINHFVCLSASFCWAVFKFLRYYSILLVSIHRFIAVYHISLFKRINKSNFFMVYSIALVWLISTVIAFFSRFVFQTSYGTNNCFDGYSETFSKSLYYYMVTVILGMAAPTFSVIVIYILIYKRLRYMSSKFFRKKTRSSRKKNVEESESVVTNRDYPSSNCTILKNFEPLTKSDTQTNGSYSQKNSSRTTFRTCKRTQTKFANQFLAINFFLIIGFVALSVASVRNLLSDFNAGWYHWIQIFRIINIFTTSLIPLITLFYPSSVLKSVLK
ncbi:G- coupled receptor moody [Brachionus plicatilis]|uniref:G-coupled receptor moody n=1 Tax=Brachionus plicatilis TaxID=10195 RepID=A0A3M7P750_BRAPC|nr:G- coupled receptor moody [Brachionus plicatilis]